MTISVMTALSAHVHPGKRSGITHSVVKLSKGHDVIGVTANLQGMPSLERPFGSRVGGDNRVGEEFNAVPSIAFEIAWPVVLDRPQSIVTTLHMANLLLQQCHRHRIAHGPTSTHLASVWLGWTTESVSRAWFLPHTSIPYSNASWHISKGHQNPATQLPWASYVYRVVVKEA
ncbi:hypothetical protein BKA83DRAFT_4124375 [Pisolithus microcarpus]|nr:hypothetical protein BKA83DRAFT_4124375 [Pisolithus microcarpus]